MVQILSVHAQLREAAVGHRQLSAWLHALEHVDGTTRRLGGLVDPARTPEDVGKQVQALGLPARVARLAPERERGVQRVDRVVDLVAHHALERSALEQICPGYGLDRIGKAQGPRVLGGALTMCPHSGRAPRRLGGEAQHGGVVARRLGVMREPGEVG